MIASRLRDRLSRVTLATLSSATALLWSGASFASQGPGGGVGTASHLTQLTMAVVVWGTSAVVVGAGLVGIARRQH